MRVDRAPRRCQERRYLVDVAQVEKLNRIRAALYGFGDIQGRLLDQEDLEPEIHE